MLAVIGWADDAPPKARQAHAGEVVHTVLGGKKETTNVAEESGGHACAAAASHDSAKNLSEIHTDLPIIYISSCNNPSGSSVERAMWNIAHWGGGQSES